MQLEEYEAFCLDTCIYILFWYFRLKVEDLDTGMFYYFHILHLYWSSKKPKIQTNTVTTKLINCRMTHLKNLRRT